MDMLNDIEDSVDSAIRHNSSAPPVAIPAGYVGPIVLPGNGRLVWWTGRVAIGLRHQPSHSEAVTESALWVQRLMLGEGHHAIAA
jgi:hypothetical protein